MKIDILTLFPNMFQGVFDESIIKHINPNKIIKQSLITLINPKMIKQSLL